MADLFSPTKLGAIELTNRIVMAPMTRDRAGPNDVPTSLMVDYYRQRASAGLIVSEGVQPSPAGKGYWRTPGIHSAEQIAGWQDVADAVHGRGGAMVMQIMHVGRVSVRANKDVDAPTVAPSAIASRAPVPGPDGVPVPAEMPRALELGEIPSVIAEFVQAARNAREAGMDGVELHCTSGYLPMQFLSTGTNRRGDQYGGSVLKRVRFVAETLEAMAGAIGADRVGFRIFPDNPYNDMHDDNPAETYGTLLRAVDRLGLAYVHVVHYPTPALDALALIRANWTGPVIANNNLKRDSAQELLNAGGVDAVSFGRPFISNPDLVERFRRCAALAPQDRDTIYSGHGNDARGYTDYPVMAE